MSKWECTLCIAGGKEHHRLTENGKAKPFGTGSDAFPTGLLTFLRLDASQVQRLTDRLEERTQAMLQQPCEATVRKLRVAWNRLVELHWFFSPLAVQRFEQEEDTSQPISLAALRELPAQVERLQGQIRQFLALLDTEAQVTMAQYAKREDRFPFGSLATGFELCHGELTEVLRPTTIQEVVEFCLRQCLARKVRVKDCKHCGEFFALTGRSSAEYCDLTVDAKGRTCKEIGAIQTWAENKKDDELFRLYRREYKRRFAWTKNGRITSRELTDWGTAAREKKAACERGEITWEEYLEWLRKE